MNRSHLLINEPPLLVIPSLAKLIGLNEAIVLQQLNYWLMNPKSEGRVDEEGNKWVFNTYEEWQENFPFWSTDKIQRIFLSLEEQELVITRQLDAKKRDMRKFYRIDYDKLCAMHGADLRLSHGADLRLSIVSKLHDVKMNQRLPEITTEKTLSPSEIEEIEESANKKVDAILKLEAEAQKRKTAGTAWRGRELLRDAHIPYGDCWHEMTGLEMYGIKEKQKVDAEWLKGFAQLEGADITIENFKAGYAAEKWRGYPSLLAVVKTAKAIQALPAAHKTDEDQSRYEALKHVIEAEKTAVPNPYRTTRPFVSKSSSAL